MAEQRRENSLLISLQELRTIEDDRVKEEEDAVRARAAAEEKAQKDAIRRAKEAEEARIREAEDKVRRAREEKERQAREEQLRLEEAERRARIDAHAKIEEARIQAETRIAVQKRLPWRIITGITAVVVACAIGGGIYLYREHEEDVARLKADKEAEIKRQRDQAEAEQRRREAEERELKKRTEELQRELTKPTAEAERPKPTGEAPPRHRGSGGKRSEGGKIEKTQEPKKSDDSLGGTLPGL